MRLPENRKLNVYKSIHRSCPSEDEDMVSVSTAKSMVEGWMPLILNYSLYNKEKKKKKEMEPLSLNTIESMPDTN